MDILGISFGIDSSACLLRDGHLVGAALEERFSRIKHDRSWPQRAIQWCLAEGKTDLASIDEIAFFWNPARQLDFAHPGRSKTYRHHGDYLHMVPSWILAGLGSAASSGPWTRQCVKGEDGSELTITYVTHHLCHVASAFYPSPYDEAAVLTVDGYGERATATLGSCNPGGYDPIEELAFPQSLGAFYAAVTGFLGFRPNSGEGKVMGLAPYGDNRFVDDFRSILGIGGDLDQPFHIDLSYFDYYLDTPNRISQRFVDRFGPPADPSSPQHSESHKAIARAAQQVTEEALLALAHRLHTQSGQKNLVLSGGVAMNSSANGRLEREGPFESIWVQPSAGDGGTAVGAALWVWHQLHDRTERHRWTHDRFGPGFSDEDCRSALRKGGWSWSEPDDVAADTAQALSNGQLIGWFQGRAELGARALGGRSILADPRDAKNKDVLNARVKFREGFRPFAPSILESHAAELCSLPDGVTVPWMQKVYPVREEAQSRLGAVVHVDGTARLQTVSETSDPLYHALIDHFGRLTGTPAVVNTSFNVRGEPMVGSPDDAIRCWATTGLDRLVLGPCVLTKK